ncbi:MAG TPA: hypothetical protein VGX03_09200 [Candidatus Binatia bacterium]|jgi:hypothetical protein|nr:hypothetical protein [Candidatus Binatia bacterium]
MNKAEMREQLWGTMLAFDAIRQRIVNTCFIAEGQTFPHAKPSLQDFTREIKKLVARCETLLKDMEETEKL